MILGRNTIQWTALITAFFGMASTLAITLFPGVDPGTVATVSGTLTAFLAVMIAFVANTSTTPIADPRLESGTIVSVLNSAGDIVGTSKVKSNGKPPVDSEDGVA